MDRLALRIGLTARFASRWLALALGLLLGLHLLAVFGHLALGKRWEAFTVLVDLDLESNLPTYFNGLLFFICAMAMGIKGLGRDGRLKRGWYTMAGVFFFLGVDEGAQIHEKFMLVTLRLLNNGTLEGGHFGWLYYAWVIPYGAAAIILALILSRWFFALEKRLRLGMVASGALYCFGAGFMEMLSGKIAEDLPAGSMTAEQAARMPCEIYNSGTCHLYVQPTYIAVYTIEEVCEMGALILCLHIILRSLERKPTHVEVVIAPKAR